MIPVSSVDKYHLVVSVLSEMGESCYNLQSESSRVESSDVAGEFTSSSSSAVCFDR